MFSGEPKLDGGGRFVHLIIHHLQTIAKVMLSMLLLLSSYIRCSLLEIWYCEVLCLYRFSQSKSMTILQWRLFISCTLCVTWQFLAHNEWTRPWSAELSQFPSGRLWKQYPDMISHFEWVPMYPLIIELLLALKLSCCSLPYSGICFSLSVLAYCLVHHTLNSSTGHFACHPNIR